MNPRLSAAGFVLITLGLWAACTDGTVPDVCRGIAALALFVALWELRDVLAAMFPAKRRRR